MRSTACSDGADSRARRFAGGRGAALALVLATLLAAARCHAALDQPAQVASNPDQASARLTQADPGVEPGAAGPARFAERTLLQTESGPLGTRATWRVDGTLEDVAASIVEGYSADGGLSLEYDGYLDLFGRVWACAVSSRAGWAQIALVDARDGEDPFAPEGGEVGGGCLLTVVTLGEVGEGGAPHGEGVAS